MPKVLLKENANKCSTNICREITKIKSTPARFHLQTVNPITIGVKSAKDLLFLCQFQTKRNKIYQKLVYFIRSNVSRIF